MLHQVITSAVIHGCQVSEALCLEKDFASAAEKVKAAKEIAEAWP